MLLPLWITKYWISGLLVQETPLKVHKAFLVENYLDIDPFQNQLTDRKITSIIESHVNTKSLADYEKLIITGENFAPVNIEPQFNENELFSFLKLNVYFLDRTNIDRDIKLDVSERDKYYNYLNYGVDLDFKLRLNIEKQQVKKPKVENNTDEILVITSGIDEKLEKKYILSILENLSKNIKKPGIYNITFDTKRSVIPLVAALKKLDIKWESYLKDNPMVYDAKLIKAPGLTEIKLGSDNSKVNDVKLDDTILNVINLDKDSDAYTEFKTSDIKYKGKIKGTKYGLVFDARK